MSIAKRADSAAIDQSTAKITADDIHILMQNVSAPTMCELSGLIADLEALRERILAVGTRAQRDVLSYACLSQSVIQLATIASQGATVVQEPTVDSDS